MAVSKVVFGNQTVMDITDTTAVPADVTSGAVFYSANGLRSVGTRQEPSLLTTDETTVQAPSGAFQTVCRLVLSKGLYIISGDLDFTANTSGIRILLLDVVEASLNTAKNSVLGTGRSALNKVRLLNLATQSSTVYLRAFQNSGTELNATGIISAIKLT